MQCHVINLASRPERLAHMRAVLGGIGISFQRFDAIDIPRSRQHPAFGLIPPMRIRPWSPGELACLLSHYEVWKLIAAGEEKYAAVFEDDLHVDPRLARLIKDPSALPPDADLVKLETVSLPVWLARRELPGPADTRFAAIRSLHYGCGAYIVSRDTAALLVRSIGAFDLPPDDVIWGIDHPLCRKLRRYQVLPALVAQDIILPAEQRTHALASSLEPARAEAAKVLEQVAPPRRSLFQRGVFKLGRMARALRSRVFWREVIVPFAAGGKSVAGAE
jgi:glycosyl transferase family 25